MAGYRPFFSFFLRKKKKRMRPISSHLDRTSLVDKGFIVWDEAPKNDFCTCSSSGTEREASCVQKSMAHAPFS